MVALWKLKSDNGSAPRPCGGCEGSDGAEPLMPNPCSLGSGPIDLAAAQAL
jgi:hypothetical protein